VAESEEAVAVVAEAAVMMGRGGYRGVGQHRGRLGQDLVRSGVNGRKPAEERVVTGVLALLGRRRASWEEQVAAEGE
jgi:hypothetical protein